MKDNYICKIPSLEEMEIKWNYEIENASAEEKSNWIIWKQKVKEKILIISHENLVFML